MFSEIIGSIKTIILLTNTPKKNKFFHQVFHQGCIQKVSTNSQIAPDLRTFSEEMLDGRLQSLQSSP